METATPARPPIRSQTSIDRDTCFSDAKGKYKAGLEKKSKKFLADAAPILARVLEEGEVIRFVTLGVSPFNLLELLTTGWWIHLLKRCLLIVTDRRILHLPTTPQGKVRSSVAEVRFGDLTGVKRSFSRVILTYSAGRKETFGTASGMAAKKVLQLLEERPAASPGTAGGERRHLCPRCAEELGADTEVCLSCGLEFKEKRKGTWISLLVPGGGYFFTGHPVLGILDAFFEVILILLLGVSLLAWGMGEPDILPSVVLLGVVLAVEKLVTIFHAHHYLKEFLPKNPGEVFQRS